MSPDRLYSYPDGYKKYLSLFKTSFQKLDIVQTSETGQTSFREVVVDPDEPSRPPSNKELIPAGKAGNEKAYEAQHLVLNRPKWVKHAGIWNESVNELTHYCDDTATFKAVEVSYREKVQLRQLPKTGTITQLLPNPYDRDNFPNLDSEDQIMSDKIIEAFSPADSDSVIAKINVLVEGDRDFNMKCLSPSPALLFGNYSNYYYASDGIILPNSVPEVTNPIVTYVKLGKNDLSETSNWIVQEMVDGVHAKLIVTEEGNHVLGSNGKWYTNNVPSLSEASLYPVLGDSIFDVVLVASNPVYRNGIAKNQIQSTFDILDKGKGDPRVAFIQSTEIQKQSGPILAYFYDVQMSGGQDYRGLSYVERRNILSSFANTAHQVNYSFKLTQQPEEGETKEEFKERLIRQGSYGIILFKATQSYRSQERIVIKPELRVTLKIKDVVDGGGKNSRTSAMFLMSARINGKDYEVCKLNIPSEATRVEAKEYKNVFIDRLIDVVVPRVTEDFQFSGARWVTPGEFSQRLEPCDLTEMYLRHVRRKAPPKAKYNYINS